MLRIVFALAVSLCSLGTTSGKTLNERLIEATRDGHLDAVAALIRDGAKVDARDESLSTPLILAASTGQVEIVQALLKAGADVNATNSGGSTALTAAARGGNAALVRVLLDAKSRVNLKDCVGRTALHLAARGGKVEIMELLLAAGANISAQDSHFLTTPLLNAVLGGNADAVRYLLRHGCPVNLRNSDGATPLHSATIGRNTNTNVVKVLLEAGADIDARHAEDGSTPLMWAAQSEHPAAVLRFLIQSHADLNKTDNQGWTALMLAEFSGQEEAAKIIKQAGGEEHTSLSYATATGDLAAVRLLLMEPVTNRPSKTELGDALCLATQKGHTAVVKELLAHGANPNTRLNGDWTPLLYTCSEGNLEIARQLLAADANVNEARIYNGTTRGPTPLMYAAANMPAEFLERLISKGARVNVTTENGDTAAGWAALGGKLQNMKVLLQHGAKINIRAGRPDGYPGWPFIQAISRGDAKLIDFLLTHGADINAGDSHGKTPLMYAVQNSKVNVVKLLIACGANVSAQADYDYSNSALKLAENTGKTEIAGLLRITEFASRDPSHERHWAAKLKRALAESTRAKIDDGPPDNAALLELTKEIVAASDTPPVIKADARYLSAMAHLEILNLSGAVSNGTARAAVETDISELQKNHPGDVRSTTLQQQLEAVLVSRAVTPLELKFKAVDGTDVDSTKFRGKVVLIDFWATWCVPCRAEIPNLVATYNELHKDGFEIIGISLDSDKERLVNVTKEAGLTWPQYFDGKGWENGISSRYGIRSIPTSWLMDKKGIVRFRDLQGETLAAQIKRLLVE